MNEGCFLFLFSLVHIYFSFVYQSWSNTRLLLKFSLFSVLSLFLALSVEEVVSIVMVCRVRFFFKWLVSGKASKRKKKNNNASGWEKIKVRVAKLELATDSKTMMMKKRRFIHSPRDLDINRTANLT